MAPPPLQRIITQNFIDKHQPPIRQETLLEASLTDEFLDEFLKSAPTFPNPIRVGIAPAYGPSDQLLAIALATESRVLVIQLQKSKGDTLYRGRGVLLTKVLSNPDCLLYAFNIGQLAISLFLDHGLRIVNGISVQGICPESQEKIVSPFAAVKFAVGDQWPIYEENIKAAFREKLWDPKPARQTSLALKAWLACFLPAIPNMEEQFNTVKRVNTKDKSDSELAQIASIARADQRLASQRPTTSANEFSGPSVNRKKLNVRSDRYQTRIQRETEAQFTVVDEHGATYLVHGRTADTAGRAAELKAEISLEGKTVIGITSTGGDRATNAETQKALYVLGALQGQVNLFESPFQRYIWCPEEDFSWPENFESSDKVPKISDAQPLNTSQHRAVHHMLSNTNPNRVTVIQGPPGTGKTSVIAAYVCSAIAGGRRGIWLVAQTNVAVKNIAEKLAKVGFLDWKLLVSKDFHMGWHEHLYTVINNNMIRSDSFKHAHKLLKGCSVILSTLSMLSNPRIKNFTAFVPMATLVVDEASQISINDYIPALQQFPSLRKMCFIGDDKQLPPFGQDENEELKSIFEVPHLRSSAQMLDTQYRMPPHIGDFISTAVYDAQLASNPLHPIQIPESYFVDVEGGEEKRDGTSWKNAPERQAALKIAAKLQEEGKDYRIITPYDAQRNLLEGEMKEMGLAWQDKCFNVDSFQGNEEDYIIISLKGMFICTKWDFVTGTAANTLVGQMAQAWGAEAWKGSWEWDEPEQAQQDVA
ncbi:P-loop containing nucleoside triphosphate hydrolase protein [Rhodofomes roseus]|uniref:P-loop containing nucleoside triphosphate hydrolase protein n=1 Tax=Rhodofomes roseus TaxID=34475 RepID=A0ABQ8KK12_9APHY|nr:P-loop containing nucleoside triphosphate hydrolase protein [Rhodofomes roseus]KAH9838487.1 P-loop containing nucleoside triphosphate hydrolase protein [Rhodofomes roseus]